jgi:hypothetical protein
MLFTPDKMHEQYMHTIKYEHYRSYVVGLEFIRTK